ncbi:hypothetical protein CWC25_22785, partial [Pseudoalteromonas sp. S4389]|uniref:lytic transglycosylase domain-containing protein n=1 Tax=Pseudoalteromonas sp. S4389 TaxID=579556 RepID=UPI001108FDA9
VLEVQPKPAELWLEFMTYTETLNYVKNVFAYMQVNHTRLGRDGNVLAPILDMTMCGYIIYVTKLTLVF